MLKYAIINCGSNGNAYVFSTVYNNKCFAIQIDAGVSIKQTKEKSESLGIKYEDVQALFV
ncbi:MAG: hypothetical protein HUK24_00970, partial [Sphaerochaetaceae bacterium]|nr:hypothetical protein [Sphaerochaetaceae bacterium]